MFVYICALTNIVLYCIIKLSGKTNLSLSLTAERTIIMAVRGKKAETAAKNANGQATFSITGTLKEVYVGKKACYATVDVQRADSEYYDRFKVSCPLDYDFPDDGKEITLEGYMKTFKGEVTFVSN